MRRRAVSALLAAAALALLGAACQTPARRGPVPGGLPFPACLDADYRGGFTVPEKSGRQRFRMAARLCPDGPALLEFRGLVGGAALLAAVRPGHEVRLVFPTRRLVVDGPDAAWFWSKWTGAPLEGRLVRGLTEAAGGSPIEVEGWTIVVGDVPADERLPGTFNAESARGDTVELVKTSERVAAGALDWPEVPRGFEQRTDRAPAPESVDEVPTDV